MAYLQIYIYFRYFMLFLINFYYIMQLNSQQLSCFQFITFACCYNMALKISNAADFEQLQIRDKKFQDYSQSYAQFGLKLIDVDIQTSLPHLVAQFLPNSDRAVDLGSNYGGFAALTSTICKSMGKQGVFWSVDPYPTNPSVVKMTSEEFMADPSYDNFDVILCKYSVHFNKNQQIFFSNVYRKLKKSGKFIIMQIGSNCVVPWTQTLDRKFKQIYVKAADIIPTNLFTYTLESSQKKIEIKKTFFRQFVRRRSWSNLMLNTQEEINECLEKLDKLESQNIEFHTCIWKYTLTKIADSSK